MSTNNLGGEDFCTNPFDSNTFKLCMCSIIVTCMLKWFKIQLVPSLHSKLIEMERVVALARLKKQRTALMREGGEEQRNASGGRRRGGDLQTLHKVQVSPIPVCVHRPSIIAIQVKPKAKPGQVSSEEEEGGGREQPKT